VRVVGTIISAILMFAGLVGLPSVPDDLPRWSPILAGIGEAWRSLADSLAPLGGDMGRWIFVIVAIGLLAFLYLPERFFRSHPLHDPVSSTVVTAPLPAPKSGAAERSTKRVRSAPTVGTAEPVAAPTVTKRGNDPWRGPALFRSGIRVDGRPDYYCPSCPFTTLDGADAVQRHIDERHQLVDLAAAADWYEDPQPWASVPMHYVGDGGEFFGGTPADRTRTVYVSERRADEIANLYARGVAPYTMRIGASVLGYTDDFGRPVEVRADKQGRFVPRSGREASAFRSSTLRRLPVAIAHDLTLAVADVREWLRSYTPPFPGEQLPQGATADEMRRLASYQAGIRDGYATRYEKRVARLVDELRTSGLQPDPEWDALDDGVTAGRLGRLVVALERSAAGLRT